MDMMARYILLMGIMAAILLYTVNAECEQHVISRIVQHWQDSHPRDILRRIVGVYTYVWLSPQFFNYDPTNIHCLATKMDPDGTTATTMYVFEDTHTKYTYGFYKTENQGKITLRSDDFPSENQYVISLENHALAYFQCMPSDSRAQFKSFVGIAVNVEHLKDPETLAAVDAANKALTALGINTGAPMGAPMTPCNPELVVGM